MAKAKGRQGEESLFPETTEIAALLSAESVQDLVILTVPSHDRKNIKLPAALAGEWASNAMRLMSDLYVGATAFRAAFGIYKTDDGHYLEDEPLVIESFAAIEAIHDVARLNLLVGFAKRMGKALDQESVMLVFGLVMYYIKDYADV